MSLDEPEPVDSVLIFPSGYDTLEYFWVKATVSVRLQILFMMLQSTNSSTWINKADLHPKELDAVHLRIYGMALELRSTNSNPFSSQTPQLQNLMERLL